MPSLKQVRKATVGATAVAQMRKQCTPTIPLGEKRNPLKQKSQVKNQSVWATATEVLWEDFIASNVYIFKSKKKIKSGIGASILRTKEGNEQLKSKIIGRGREKKIDEPKDKQLRRISKSWSWNLSPFVFLPQYIWSVVVVWIYLR